MLHDFRRTLITCQVPDNSYVGTHRTCVEKTSLACTCRFLAVNTHRTLKLDTDRLRRAHNSKQSTQSGHNTPPRAQRQGKLPHKVKPKSPHFCPNFAEMTSLGRGDSYVFHLHLLVHKPRVTAALRNLRKFRNHSSRGLNRYSPCVWRKDCSFHLVVYLNVQSHSICASTPLLC